MTTNFRAFPFALVLMGLTVLTSRAKAQDSRLAPQAIGQIVDEVLNALIPPGELVSRVPVAKRGIFFDHVRTLFAFGYSYSAAPLISLADLRLRTSVKPGSRHLLDDCSQAYPKSCSNLGWGVYVIVEPISITSSEALVRADITWPDRGPVPFEEGVAPTGHHAYLVGYSQEVYLTRSQDGRWKFEKKKPGAQVY